MSARRQKGGGSPCFLGNTVLRQCVKAHSCEAKTFRGMRTRVSNVIIRGFDAANCAYGILFKVSECNDKEDRICLL